MRPGTQKLWAFLLILLGAGGIIGGIERLRSSGGDDFLGYAIEGMSGTLLLWGGILLWNSERDCFGCNEPEEGHVHGNPYLNQQGLLANPHDVQGIQHLSGDSDRSRRQLQINL